MSRPPFTRIVQELPATVPFTAPEEFERRSGRPLKLRLGANESHFGASPGARAAMAEAAEGTYNYCDPTNYDLREELACRHGVAMENLVTGAGIDDMLGLIVRAFLEPGEVAVNSLGGYPTFNYHVLGYGGRLETAPYRNDRNDLGALAETARRTGARMIFLSNPDNPTGTYYAGDDIRAFIDKIPPDCLLLLDEAYCDFAPAESALPLDPEDPQVIRLRTFSKAHGMAGARVGYALAHRDTISAFNKIRLHFGVSLMAQAGALASLRDPDFIRGIVRAVEQGRREYHSLAKELGLATLPSSANYVAIDLRTAENAKKVVEELIHGDVFVRSPGAPPLNRLVRVTVGTPLERAAFGDIFRSVIASCQI